VDHDARDHLRLGGDDLSMWWYYYDSLDQLVKVKFSDGQLTVDRHTYALNQFERVFIVGAGKASAAMAQALESAWKKGCMSLEL